MAEARYETSAIGFFLRAGGDEAFALSLLSRFRRGLLAVVCLSLGMGYRLIGEFGRGFGLVGTE
jgi:hypothetical protein